MQQRRDSNGSVTSKSDASYLFPQPLDMASSQLQETSVTHSQRHWLCIFASNEQEPECHTRRKICKSAPAEATHCLTATMQASSGRCCPRSPLARTDGSQKAPNPEYGLGVVGQSSQTLLRVRPSANCLGAQRYRAEGERPPLFWLESGTSGLQLSQRCDIAVRVCSLVVIR
jgi:hypothetical protein